MAEAPIFSFKNLSIAFGEKNLFSGIEANINRGDKISLVGRNGSGKSTLLKIIAGVLDPDNGEIFVQPGLKIAYMPQEPDLSSFLSLRDVVASKIISDEQNKDYLADIWLEKLKIDGSQNPLNASGGECRKAALAQALIDEPDMLLLDEPTNHLDVETIELLENVIKEFKGAVVVISHDRRFLSHITDAMLWLDRGNVHFCKKGFAYFEEWQEEIIAKEINEQNKLLKKISEETEWLHKGVTARRRRNMGRLRKLIELRKLRKEQIKQIGNVNLNIDEGDFRSKLVIEAKNISKSFGQKEIVKDFSTKIIRGNKIGIVGPNGAGKTTLIKLLIKCIEPDKGFVRLGKNLQMAYFDQNRIILDGKKTLWQTLCDKGDHLMVHGKWRHVVAYLKDFLFKPSQANSPVSSLSGGEKNRLMLAKILSEPSNFLVLDEPTNDLDMDTLDLLQEVLDEYQGTVLIISHDRDFLDKVAASIIYMKGNGQVFENVGTYSELLEKVANKNKEIAKPKNENKSFDSSQKIKQVQKLSYAQERLRQILPQEIESLEIEIANLIQELSDPCLYQNNPTKFDSVSTELMLKQQEKALKEEQWLELELKKEQLNA